MERSARRWLWTLVPLLTAVALVAAACGGDEDGEETTGTTGETGGGAEGFVFGMILVGPQNDHGWSQAHYEAGEYVEEQLGAEMVVIDKVNTADRPETSVEQVAADMIADGAQMVFATSDDMKDGVQIAAAENPDVPMVWSSGDSAWPEGKGYREDLTNLANVMGRMEYGTMMAGCAAALTSQTGKIGYLGPLINDETRRLANSAYLGARYCWETYRGEDPASLGFSVNWIGFWFNLPGVTLDPTQVTNDFFDSGHDVVISGIDTTEALVRAGQRAEAGEEVWAIPYDFKGACAEAPDVCLGVPYFNWGPSYVELVQKAADGSFEPTFQWLGPDWADINNPDTSMIGFEKGPGLSEEASGSLDEFIAGLADGSIELYTGPLNWQDGSPFLAEGEVADDVQLWYQEQLLEGMEGASSAE
ncbi:MAG TPA: BMP family ABC transporter substrate-binding protein [Actinomycetota bacterium]|nr:BMP family ABC transporter substrate-binding protein [Actinomycetota bacterium]